MTFRVEDSGPVDGIKVKSRDISIYHDKRRFALQDTVSSEEVINGGQRYIDYWNEGFVMRAFIGFYKERRSVTK